MRSARVMVELKVSSDMDYLAVQDTLQEALEEGIERCRLGDETLQVLSVLEVLQ